MSSFIQVRSALLNILLDRIAASHPENRKGGEIEGLPVEKLKGKEFKAKLTALMTEICPEWTADATGRYIVSHVARCNSRPSFVAGIQRVCQACGLKAPTGNFLETRHKLMHEGELVREDGDMVAYMKELDWLAARLLMRMLSYEGNYFHTFSGTTKCLKDELVK